MEPVTRNEEETSSSGSYETKRLRAANAKWNPPPPEEVTSEEDDADGGGTQWTQVGAGCSKRPVTSGVFHFCNYIIEHILDEDGRAQISKQPYCYMDFCAGLGTSVICTEALRRSLLAVGKTLDATCVCLTEKCPKKLAVLKGYKTGATMFAETATAVEDPPQRLRK